MHKEFKRIGKPKKRYCNYLNKPFKPSIYLPHIMVAFLRYWRHNIKDDFYGLEIIFDGREYQRLKAIKLCFLKILRKKRELSEDKELDIMEFAKDYLKRSGVDV